MNAERLFNHVKDVALTLGEWALYQIRDLETPPTTPASIQHYGTKEAPLDGAPQAGDTVFTDKPDYTNQLRFHQQQLLQGLPEAMHNHHAKMADKLGRAA